MAVEQLPGQVREFAQYLNGLLSRLDQGGGWCGVFWHRDPEGMRACLDGSEMPPWDVVQALLQDLAAAYGPRAAGQESERARALHSAALAAYDARPGGRDALSDRLDVMLREQRYAAERHAELGQSLHTAATQQEADSIRLDLAWARDDHERATARCAELRSRMDELDRRSAGGYAQGALRIPPGDDGGVFWVDEASGGGGGPSGAGAGAGASGAGDDAYAGSGRPHMGAQRSGADEDDWPDVWRDAAAERSGQGAQSAQRRPSTDQDAWGRTTPRAAARHSGGTPVHATSPQPTASAAPAESEAPSEPPQPPAEPPVPKQRSKRRPRGGARYAGIVEDDAAATAVPAMPVPPTRERSLRGARFAGVAAEPERPKPKREPLDDEARRVTVETVESLIRLRREGRSGEAHALLVEAAYWPAARFPLLASELHRAGLGADWATLLWEAASLPAGQLVSAADALVATGRTADGQQLLRQGVVRPAPEIGEAVLGLVEEGRNREARALLDAYVRIRTPEEAARSVEADPQRLVPLLLEAAQRASEDHHWNLVHALRVAGYTA
ncbi:hypothetical protein [Streptomyces sp. 2A115]|uniref:hypothetical protein n=1 Tax=Streptomyces sp. 2A115 TaxID=3457439 RepID=UPI003FD2C76E